MSKLSRAKSPEIHLESIFASHYGGVKMLRYSIETASGSFELNVDVPYHHDDREADRLGRVEVYRLLSSVSGIA